MKPYLRHLRSASDLKTSYEATRAGFVALALEKNRRSTPIVEEARALKAAASLARMPADLLKIEIIQPALVTAAGISDKARKHLVHQDVDDAVQGLISKYLEPAGDNCRGVGIQVFDCSRRYTRRLYAEPRRRSGSKKVDTRHHFSFTAL